MASTWHVNVFNERGLFFTAPFETRGKAAAYAMRWNRRGAPYKAVMVKIENAAPYFPARTKGAK